MTFFFDTNVLLTESEAFFDNLEDKFYISNLTIHELENIKTSFNKAEETKYKARMILHWLDNNKDKYEITVFKNNLSNKILMVKYALPNTPDSKIILCAYKLNKKIQDFYFVTKDISCKTIARELQIPIYEIINKQEEYTGYKTIVLSDEELSLFYGEFFPNNINHYDLQINQYLLIKNHDDIVDKYKWTIEGYQKVQHLKFETQMFGKLAPKDNDIYQLLALDCLNNNKISMLRGPAGSGKSYLAFGYMFSLLEKGKIDRIIIFCNTVATKGSAKLGFYPGTRTEKLLDSQIGNFLTSKLGDRFEVEKLIEHDELILLPFSDIRGYDTTGMRAAIYITEAQNLDIELMRLALQRIGEDSICILDGDSETQVDLDMYAGDKNGMRRVSQVFRNHDFYGEVTLQSIKRSRIAELAQKL